MIQVADLSKVYDRTEAVSGLSFEVAPGEVLGLVGPNGAGKTTTLRCISGIIPMTHGRVAVAGHDVATAPIEAKKRLAFVPDDPRLFDYLSVTEHLRFMARLYEVPDAEARAGDLIRELELVGKEGALPGALSRGMRQKLAIACGLLHDPSVILFDEPLTGLDPAAIRRIKDLMRQRAAAGAAVVVSSHLLGLVEEISDRVLIIQRGRKVAHGRLDELKADHAEHGDADLEDLFFRITRKGEGEEA